MSTLTNAKRNTRAAGASDPLAGDVRPAAVIGSGLASLQAWSMRRWIKPAAMSTLQESFGRREQRPVMKLRLRCLSGAMLCLVSAAFGQDEGAPQPDPMALSRQAVERARTVTITAKPPAPSPAQQQHLEALAGGARDRARLELSRLAEEHPFTPAATAAATPDNPDPAVDLPLAGRVVVALSSSMPESLLREYMAQLDGHREAIVVLRGFIGGARTVRPTGALIEHIRRKLAGDPHSPHRAVEVVVDPLIYQSLGIDKVPAVAWLPDVTDLAHCDGQTFESAVTVFGAVSVSYALRTINRNGGQVPDEVLRSFGGRS